MRAALALIVLAGCTPAYIYGSTATVNAAPKPAGCGFQLLDAAPRQPYDELGIVAPSDIEDGDMAGGGPMFIDAVKPYVCPAGGDAVVVERDTFGRYVRGTVIRFKSPHSG